MGSSKSKPTAVHAFHYAPSAEPVQRDSACKEGLVKNSPSLPAQKSSLQTLQGNATTNINGKFIAVYDTQPDISMAVVMEHYMPYEFPICPVITSDSQRLVVESWRSIVAASYDSEDTASGKVSGATYFYNQFFDQLFARLRDFERIFPNIKARADIISHVMAMITSVRAENLDYMKLRLKSLGAKHINIVMDPWLFGIYVTTIHTTIRICLDEEATPEIMGAWLHVISFVLRNMLPHYFGSRPFSRWYEGATNAAAAMNTAAQEEIKVTDQVKLMKSGNRSRPGISQTQSRPGAEKVAAIVAEKAAAITAEKERSANGPRDSMVGTGSFQSPATAPANGSPYLTGSLYKGERDGKTNMCNSIDEI